MYYQWARNVEYGIRRKLRRSRCGNGQIGHMGAVYLTISVAVKTFTYLSHGVVRRITCGSGVKLTYG
jgi:hypothetical protein